MPRPVNQEAYATNWAKAFRSDSLKAGDAVNLESVAPTGSDEERIAFLTKQRDQMAEELLGCRDLIKRLQEEMQVGDWIESIARDRQANG